MINAVVLVALFFVFKLLTGNIIEVKMYSTRGGEFMRMHPVVMMALIILFEALFGISGMFLAIPVVAAMKYCLVSTNTPAVFLHPLLKIIEGDEAAAHRMFVHRRRLHRAPSDHGALPSTSPRRTLPQEEAELGPASV